jgi:hypothetical protein
MSHLKSLTLTSLTTNADPHLARRQRLLERLNEQLELAKDPTYAPIERRWVKSDDGTRRPVDSHRVIKPWWRTDGAGNLVLTLKNGLKVIEIEKGKPAIVVGTPDKLIPTLNTAIAAVKAGELDRLLDGVNDSRSPRAKKPN